jgi:hypothetical protein
MLLACKWVKTAWVGFPMANFGEVFSTTWKVLLALFLISLGVGLVYLVIGVMAHSGGGSASDDSTRIYHVKNADEAHTGLPKSQWDREIKRCIKEHTIVEGMTKDQVKQAIGGGEPWLYSLVTLKGSYQKCIRYEGEQCAEYPPDEVKSFALHFTPKGNLIWDDDSIGLSVYGKNLPNLPISQAVSPDDSSKATKRAAMDSRPLQGNRIVATCSPLGPCLAILRTGFRIRHEHRVVMGATTRLYLSTDDSSFTDVPTEEITGYEKDSSPPAPVPRY